MAQYHGLFLLRNQSSVVQMERKLEKGEAAGVLMHYGNILVYIFIEMNQEERFLFRLVIFVTLFVQFKCHESKGYSVLEFEGIRIFL